MPTILRQYWIQLTSGFFIVLFLLAFFSLWRDKERAPELIMQEHIQQLHAAFVDIENTAGIIDFEHGQNYIDFLNVISFEGSELGSMNLKDPSAWNGPYFHDNPTIQEKMYQIVHTKKGYFITPGPGVKLANGKKIGKDIILNYDADIPAMMTNPDLLAFEGKALAAPLELKALPSSAPAPELESITE